MKRICAFLLVLVVTGISPAASVVNDPNLRTAVITRLNMDANYIPPINPLDANRPDANDMNRPSFTYLSAPSVGISDLNGLQYATYLQTLYLNDNNLADVNQLSGLTKIQILDVSYNFRITSLSHLSTKVKMKTLRARDCNLANIYVVTASNFPKLETLSVGYNSISVLTSLIGMNTLRYLYLYGNDISNINPIAGLTGLLELDLSENYISDYNAVSGLTNLIYLDLSYNNSNDMTPLAGLTKLTYLGFGGNGVTDINSSIISNFGRLQKLYLSDNMLTGSTLHALSDLNDTFTNLYLSNNNIVDVCELAEVNQIQQLRLKNNNIENIEPLTTYVSLTVLDIRDNPLDFDSYCKYLQYIIDRNPGADITYSLNNQPLLWDCMTDLYDMRIFSYNWLSTGCNANDNGYCDGADLNESTNVDLGDFVIFADWWLWDYDVWEAGYPGYQH
jgi:Leucine-rich repeat (LRR) protein